MTDVDDVEHKYIAGDGVHHKYIVTRTDGRSAPGEAHDECAYFVLDLNCDPHARSALTEYARVCRRSNPELARDIGNILRTPRRSRCNCREVACPHAFFGAFIPDGPSGAANKLMAQRGAKPKVGW